MIDFRKEGYNSSIFVDERKNYILAYMWYDLLIALFDVINSNSL